MAMQWFLENSQKMLMSIIGKIIAYTWNGIDLRFLRLLNMSLRGGGFCEIADIHNRHPPRSNLLPSKTSGDCFGGVTPKTQGSLNYPPLAMTIFAWSKKRSS